MLTIGAYEKNVLFRVTDDNTGEMVTQLLLSPETAIMLSDKILENVKLIKPNIVKPKQNSVSDASNKHPSSKKNKKR